MKKKVNGQDHHLEVEYCAECHMTFGSAEPRVAVDRDWVMHEDCYVKYLAKKANQFLPVSIRLN